jgi:hypothetical protein
MRGKAHMSAQLSSPGMSEAERRRRMERALALGGPTHTVADVVERIRDGRAQFWQNGDGMIVTEIHEFPLRKGIHYWLAFGELQQCLALQPEIDAWAVEQGCTTATIFGRRGWGRAAASWGWKLWHPNFIKQLDPIKERGQ